MISRALGGALACLALLSACGGSQANTTASRGPRQRSVKVAFVGQEIWFVAPDRRWRLDGVTKRDVVWAPNGRQLAYGKAPATTARTQRWRIFVRDEAGEPVNEFPVYRDGRPEGIEFRGDRRLAYEMNVDTSGASVAPVVPAAASPAEPPRLLVEHDVRTGEIVAVHRGRSFVWSPDRRALAYIGLRAALGERVQVDATRVYPRSEAVGGVSVVSKISWAPDGKGLAFLVTRSEQKGRRRSRPDPASGKVVLVVVLEPDDASGDLTWNVPPGKDPAEQLNVFWAGRSRVVVGPAQLKPRFSASWQRER